MLSEKPVAQNVASAKELIVWYNSCTAPPIWAVGENFRFNESVKFAENKVREIGGHLTTFRLNYNGFVKKDNKYFNTNCRFLTFQMDGASANEYTGRKTPEFQGGFVLDTGVHFVASLRLLLAAVGDEITQIVSYSGLLENHLHPVDTVHSIVSTKGARHGTICMSFGTEFKSGLEIEITTTNGAVLWKPVGVKSTTKSESGELLNEQVTFVYNNAVRTEIEAFSQSIVAGAPDPRQTPLEALKDLVVLQALVESGEGGALVKDI